jgi:hypothetical protein
MGCDAVWLQLLGTATVVPSSPIPVKLMIGATRSSDTSVSYKSHREQHPRRRHIQNSISNTIVKELNHFVMMTSASLLSKPFQAVTLYDD